MGNVIPLIIAVAQEGGRVNVIPSEIRKIPAIKYVAERGDKNLIYETSNLIGRIIKLFGFNMNFWPILDLGGMVDGKALSDRCISNNPTIVSSYSTLMINAQNDAGIIAVPKYFPGHNTTKNKGGSLIIPSTSKSIQKLEQADIVPFKSAMDNNIEAITVGNINLSKLNLFAPATLSYKVLTKLLKGKYEYKGVIVSDDLTMPCVDIQYGIKGSVRRAILAGCDLMVVRDSRKVKEVLLDVAKQIKNGNIDTQEINLRVQKIIDLKDKFKLKDEELPQIDIDSLNKEIESLIERIRK